MSIDNLSVENLRLDAQQEIFKNFQMINEVVPIDYEKATFISLLDVTNQNCRQLPNSMITLMQLYPKLNFLLVSISSFGASHQLFLNADRFRKVNYYVDVGGYFKKILKLPGYKKIQQSFHGYIEDEAAINYYRNQLQKSLNTTFNNLISQLTRSIDDEQPQSSLRQSKIPRPTPNKNILSTQTENKIEETEQEDVQPDENEIPSDEEIQQAYKKRLKLTPEQKKLQIQQKIKLETLLPICFLINVEGEIVYQGSQFTQQCKDNLNKLSGMLTDEEAQKQALLLTQHQSQQEKERQKAEAERLRRQKEEEKRAKAEAEAFERRKIIYDDEKPLYIIDSTTMVHQVQQFVGQGVAIQLFSTSQKGIEQLLTNFQQLKNEYKNVYFLLVTPEHPHVVTMFFNLMLKKSGLKLDVNVASDQRGVFQGYIAKHGQSSFGTTVLFNPKEQPFYLGNIQHFMEMEDSMKLMTGNNLDFYSSLKKLNEFRPMYVQLKLCKRFNKDLNGRPKEQKLNLYEQYLLFNKRQVQIDTGADHKRVAENSDELRYSQLLADGQPISKIIVIEFIPEFNIPKNIHCYKDTNETEVRYLRDQTYAKIIPIFNRISELTYQYPDFYILAVTKQDYSTMERLRYEFPILRSINIGIDFSPRQIPDRFDPRRYQSQHAIIFNMRGDIYWQGQPMSQAYPDNLKAIYEKYKQHQELRLAKSKGRNTPTPSRQFALDSQTPHLSLEKTIYNGKTSPERSSSRRRYYQKHTGALRQLDI